VVGSKPHYPDDDSFSKGARERRKTMLVHHHIDPAAVTVDRIVDAGRERFQIGDTVIRVQQGLPVITANDRWAEIPVELRKHIVRVHIETKTIEAYRRSGFYRLGDAEGTVECTMTDAGKFSSCKVEISAPTKEEALALWDAILTGNITPDADHEAVQVTIPTIDRDRFERLQAGAGEIAMKLVEDAMAELKERAQAA